MKKPNQTSSYVDQLTIKKPTQALVMMPKIGKLSIVARKLFNMILHSTQKQIAIFIDAGKDVPAGHLFKCKLNDLVDPLEFGESNLRSLAKLNFKEMRDIHVEWSAPDQTQSGFIWENYSLLSDAKLKIEDGALIAYWAFSSSVFNALRYPDQYARINVLQLAKLTSYEAVVLYEICSRYKTNPLGLTVAREPVWWVKALSSKLPAAINPETNEPNWRGWSQTKIEKVLGAISEINSETDLSIELIEKKEIRTIVSVQFKVKVKTNVTNSEQIEAVTQPSKLSQKVAEFASKLEISLSDVFALSKFHSDLALVDAMVKLEARINQQDADPIKSKLAYLKKILGELNAIVDYKSAPQAQTLLPPKLVVLAKPEAEAEAVYDYKTTRRMQIRAEMLNQPFEVRLKFAEIGLQKLQTIGMSNPNLATKVSAGIFENPLLISQMTEAYAVDVYGKDWGLENN